MKRGAGQIFAESESKEQVEHSYGFSGQNIEEYSAVLENKLDSLQSSADQARREKAAK